METRQYFTLAEAERTLPLVARIVADIVRDYAVWRERVRAFEATTVSEAPAARAGRLRLQEEIETLAQQIEECVRELSDIGCVFKGFEEGLVDFYGRVDGREVFWCWKLGETAIEYWHEVDAGFSGRQPIASMVGPFAE